MSSAYKFRQSSLPHFISFATCYWIDVFTRPAYSEIVTDSIRYCQANKGLVVYGWCIMPSHVHMIVSSKENALGDIIRDLKRHTAKALLAAIETHPAESRKDWMLWMFRRAGQQNGNNDKHQFWQHENHPQELYSQDFFDQKLAYIHQNPVEAGLVEQPHYYLQSSARNYADRNIVGPINLVFGGW